MHLYPARVLERAMKIREVIARAMSGRINWIQAAEILGMSDRQLRRWRNRWSKHGYNGLFDYRTQRPSPKRVPLVEVEKVLTLYREKYFDLNVQHFVEKLKSEHQIGLIYTATNGEGLAPIIRCSVERRSFKRGLWGSMLRRRGIRAILLSRHDCMA